VLKLRGGSLADVWPSPTPSPFLYTEDMEALNEEAERVYSSIRSKLVIFLFNFILIAATIRAEQSYMKGSAIGLVPPSI